MLRTKFQIIIFLLLVSLVSNGQLFTFRNFDYKNGLPITSITSVQTDSKGAVYLGTDGAGLYKFNGESFDEEGRSAEDNHHITSISISGDRLYFASRYKGVFEIYQNKIKIHRVPSHQEGEWTKVFAFGESLFFSNDRAFYVKDSKGQKKLQKFHENVIIYQIIELQKGILILSSGGNFYYNPDSRRLQGISKWYGKGGLSQMRYGFSNGNRIVLYNKELTKRIEVVLAEDDKVFSYHEKPMVRTVENFTEVKSCTYSHIHNRSYFLTVDDRLQFSDGSQIYQLEQNYAQPMKNCNSLKADVHGNIWCASSSRGLYKISIEPFTKVLAHKEFRKQDIFCLAKSNDDMLFSALNGITYVSRARDSKLLEYNFYTSYCVQDKDYFWLATKTGVKRIHKQTYEASDFSIEGIDGENLTLLEILGTHLYIGVYGKGLKKYNLEQKRFEQLKFTNGSPNFVYTFQHSPIVQKNYFGTNNSVWEEDVKTGQVSQVKGIEKAGYYSGVSTKDAFGNFWFTGDHGLIGILKNGETILLNNKEYFNSTLFYTINSDAFGNLIIGTNKGLTILKVDEFGRVLSVNFYNRKNGFDGYETNMRAQFQNENEILVSTVEGIMRIDMRMLENLPRPTPPVISEFYQRFENQPNSLHAFRLSSNNPAVRNVKFTYRIVGKDEKWSSLMKNPIVYVDDLENGTYIFEAKATYDGKVFSNKSTYTFQVNGSVWKSKSLIIFVVGVLLLLALFAISRRKTLEGANFFDSTDVLVELKFAPSILLISFLTNFGVNLFVSTVDPTLPNTLPITMSASFLMLVCYALSKVALAAGRTDMLRFLLNATFSIFILQSYLNIYLSDLHFLYVTALAMINTVAPYIYKRFIDVVVHNLLLILVTIFFFVYFDNLTISKYIFLTVLLLSGALSIFLTFLRFDSLDKLSFISGIVNSGNVPVIVFNQAGNMTFVSQNIKSFLPVSRDEIIGKKISHLNQFLLEGDNLRSIDFTKEFNDNHKYVARMISNQNETIWIEWTCKVFADNINCMIGQDVSDRIDAESTYKLLVESAEDLIYHTDIKGNISFSNDRFNQFFGFDPKATENVNSSRLVHPDYREAVWEFYQNHFKERKMSSYFEFQVIDAFGNTRWIGQHVSSRLNPHNPKHIIGFLVVARDITQNLLNERLILEQNKEITSSIQYSKQIQQALFTSNDYIEHLFKEHFLMFKPKDIVSGDFYWFHRTDEKLLIAIGDCTGHGVPGAFMTLLGINQLNTIVIENHYHDPSQILNEMDKRLLNKLFKQNENSINDGIELTVCCIDIDSLVMSYACAGSRFLIYNEEDFQLYKGDNKHIGDVQEGFTGYFGHHVNLKDTDTVYFVTDGFQDQFGGSMDKRFSFRRLLETIEANSLLPLEVQRKLIEEEFDGWKGEFEQTDDVTIFAFKGINA